ncbi:MAG: guanylate kinase [Candidatus Omnitrophica bacterium]|nr:guanylate kinase [Candidatus Omnitrophota bacterium]
MNKSKTSNRGPASPGLLVILSAPSGCGKTTIVDRLLKRHPQWMRSISVTTRLPREGEVDGTDYFFVTDEALKKMDSRGELLESARVFDYYYGTPKKFVEEQLKQSKIVIMTIDVQGTAKIKASVGTLLPMMTIFVLPPSVKVLRERLESRKTEGPEAIEKRIVIAQDEIKEAGWYDFTVVNQNLDQTITEMEGFIDQVQKRKE